MKKLVPDVAIIVMATVFLACCAATQCWSSDSTVSATIESREGKQLRLQGVTIVEAYSTPTGYVRGGNLISTGYALGGIPISVARFKSAETLVFVTTEGKIPIYLKDIQLFDAKAGAVRCRTRSTDLRLTDPATPVANVNQDAPNIIWLAGLQDDQYYAIEVQNIARIDDIQKDSSKRSLFPRSARQQPISTLTITLKDGKIIRLFDAVVESLCSLGVIRVLSGEFIPEWYVDGDAILERRISPSVTVLREGSFWRAVPFSAIRKLTSSANKIRLTYADGKTDIASFDELGFAYKSYYDSGDRADTFFKGKRLPQGSLQEYGWFRDLRGAIESVEFDNSTKAQK